MSNVGREVKRVVAVPQKIELPVRLPVREKVPVEVPAKKEKAGVVDRT